MAHPRVLVDSSFWIDHLAGKTTPLEQLLKIRRVALHPMVIGEIAMGSLRNRNRLIGELQKLPKVPVATNPEVMAFVEWHKLFSTGIGFVDAHLLAAATMTDNATLLTKDGRLHAQAERLGVAYVNA